ncbi:BadF/BadG/BcrA/BcrD ATPase family protein [Rubellimicrobium roseum]|uniref:ATPase BadF/BadG/BcrA/BcrD type domain-containing protein n=1 Tax=Rubellimicrobium roseum TaxID=687525 RepID=A0A5C4NAE5_9RHOB|nr:BadF/BadG/BcrA/BcrD ATPase family protein [Rubellimicrobium roseum]TNC71821.1 hypothetical protein FHG71_10400 [Rubellimicrobium roseum]
MTAGTWVAALDGGGTKTAVALADRRGEVLRRPSGAGCNPQDGSGWDGVLRTAVTDALDAPGGLAAMMLGLPGHGEVPAHDAATLALLRDLLPVPFEPVNDVALAHLGAFGGGFGVLVLSGTGSMAWARGPAGEVRVGGWGDLLGDEGSAHAIGRAALTAAARALDGRLPQARPFADALLPGLGSEATGPFAPLTWLMAQEAGPRPALAGVARQVDALAQQGDETAAAILEEAGDDLAWAARTAAQRAGLPGPSPWVPAGGVFQSRAVLAAVTDRLGPPSDPQLSVLGGGLLRAARLAGWNPDAAWAARIETALR